MTAEPNDRSHRIEQRLAEWYRGLARDTDGAAVAHVSASVRARRVAHIDAMRIGALRTAAAVVLFVAGGVVDRMVLRRGTLAADPSAIVFVFRAPAAHQVSLIGDFNNWNDRATRLVRRSDGTWSTALRLAPGIHAYAYMVDDSTWTTDPLAPRASADDFGSPTSTVVVSPGQGS